MSRAFVSEDATDASSAALPERPVSKSPNLVTSNGLALLDAEVARLQDLLGSMAPDDVKRPRLARDLRYWRARLASARVVTAATGAPDAVVFGVGVTLRRGETVTHYRIVGEDEADPQSGLLSWTSPLAEALMGARVGDVVEVGGGRAAVTLERIESG